MGKGVERIVAECVGELLLLDRCIETARKVGVHREFYVFSDRKVVGAICYEAGGVKSPEDRQFCVYLSDEIKKLLLTVRCGYRWEQCFGEFRRRYCEF